MVLEKAVKFESYLLKWTSRALVSFLSLTPESGWCSCRIHAVELVTHVASHPDRFPAVTLKRPSVGKCLWRAVEVP